MRFFYALLLMIFTASCTKEAIEIKNSSVQRAGINDAYIRTAKEMTKEPKIDAIIPKNGDVIKDRRIEVKLNISNFKLVTPDNYPNAGQGHVQVWVDGMEFRGSKTEFVFENESNGIHTIKAELMLSNNTVLPYSKTIRVVVNNT